MSNLGIHSTIHFASGGRKQKKFRYVGGFLVGLTWSILSKKTKVIQWIKSSSMMFIVTWCLWSHEKLILFVLCMRNSWSFFHRMKARTTSFLRRYSTDAPPWWCGWMSYLVGSRTQSKPTKWNRNSPCCVIHNVNLPEVTHDIDRPETVISTSINQILCGQMPTTKRKPANGMRWVRLYVSSFVSSTRTPNFTLCCKSTTKARFSLPKTEIVSTQDLWNHVVWMSRRQRIYVNTESFQ